MKSVWIDDWFTPCSTRSLGAQLARPVDRLQDRGAERDVRRRVLVEQRVVEDEPRLADRRVPVDERDLAEPGRAVVGRDVRAHDLLARTRAWTSTARPPSKRISRSRTMLPWICSGSVERTWPSTRGSRES